MKKLATASSVFLLLSCTNGSVSGEMRRYPSSLVLSERFEKKLLNEEENIDRIREGFLFVQQKHANSDGKLLRGTHSKGMCLNGELEVSDLSGLSPEIAARLRKGMFSLPGSYPTLVRFANAAGSIQADQAKDVRAVSFQVHGIPSTISNSQGRMDFAMNDSSTFPLNDSKVFADLMVIEKEGKFAGGMKVGVDGLKGVAKALYIGFLQQRAPYSTFQKMTYWCDVPFALGESEAVKYSLVPCEKNKDKDVGEFAHDPNAMFNELRRTLKEDETCFYFRVQLLEAAKMHDSDGQQHSEQEWVESAAMEWSEKEAPFYTVGKLKLAGGEALSSEICEQQKIDVITNNNNNHRGLGSINRARTAAEAASAQQRLGR